MCSGATVTAGVAAVNCWAIFSQMAFSSTEPKNEKRTVPPVCAAPGKPVLPALPVDPLPPQAASNPPSAAPAAPVTTARRVRHMERILDRSPGDRRVWRAPPGRVGSAAPLLCAIRRALLIRVLRGPRRHVGWLLPGGATCLFRTRHRLADGAQPIL